jgi:hypothetical protein
MSRSGPTAPTSPKENFGRPARRSLLRLVEPRSVNRRFNALAPPPSASRAHAKGSDASRANHEPDVAVPPRNPLVRRRLHAVAHPLEKTALEAHQVSPAQIRIGKLINCAFILSIQLMNRQSGLVFL